MSERIIKAVYDNDKITVYQAYNNTIANFAVNNQNFISPPFKKERMTWIKPSFLWMMYRSEWASKENQECILSIEIKREGFEWALENSCLSRFDSTTYNSYATWQQQLNISPIRIQWDPDRDIFSNPLPCKAIQIGLSSIAVEKYINNWIINIKDITDMCRNIKLLLKNGKIQEAVTLLPKETAYPISEPTMKIINAS